MARHVGKAGAGVKAMARKRTAELLVQGLLLLALGFLLTRWLAHTWFWYFFGLGLMWSAVVMWGDRATWAPVERAIRGAGGEERVAKALSSLPDGYVVFHDVLCPVGNIDHIVVGPAGVFLIEAKSHRGEITVSPEGELLRDGRPFEKNVLSQVWRETRWLKETLESHLGRRVYVHPFLVFSHGLVKVHGAVRGVMVLPADRVVGVIEERPERLTEKEISEMEKVLTNRLA
ncbi:MAG: NERD domain-containing protein [Clostridiales bacterium]|nr:NERD domain-containing protein [Clostridiales bacterium]